MTKLKLFIFFTLITALLYSAGLETIGLKHAKRRYVTTNTVFLAGISGTDSIHFVSKDSLINYLTTYDFIDSTVISDSITAYNSRIMLVIADSTGALVDSLKVVLSDSKTYTRDAINDSLTQSLVVFPNNIITHGTVNIDSTGDNLLKFGHVADGSVWLVGEDDTDAGCFKIDYYSKFEDGLFALKIDRDYRTYLSSLEVSDSLIGDVMITAPEIYEEKNANDIITYKNQWVRIAQAPDLSESNYAYFDLDWAGDWLHDTPAPPGGYLRMAGNAQFLMSADIGDTAGVNITMLKSSFMEPELYRMVSKIRVIVKDRTLQNDSSPAYLEAYVQYGEEKHFTLTKHNSQGWNILDPFIVSTGIPEGYSAYEVSTANSFSVTGYDSEFSISNTGDFTVGGDMTVNGLLDYKIPFAKFERTTNFVASAPNVWVNIPIPTVSGSNNTNHFTQIFSPDTCIVIGKKMILNITATLKTYCGINISHTTYFRIVKGRIGSTRVSSKCGQDVIKETKAIGDLDKRSLCSDIGFDVGDTLYVQMKTTNVGIILQEFSGFDNPNSATLNLKYVMDY